VLYFGLDATKNRKSAFLELPIKEIVLKSSSYTQKYPSLSITYTFIFIIGLACMSVAGYFLIEGLSQFSGSNAAKRMLIAGGILFQITESICFISASALTYHSLTWRYTLFGLGLVLFSFSIGVMTLAQKTALQTGEAQAQAIDEKRDYTRKQIDSLDRAIASYRFNAEKQSKSIYKDSRALGQDSLNRAITQEEKKQALSEELFKLNEARRQTSSDFFTRIEDVTGLPANSTEFYFLLIRSLLLELCGIILMSFGANLRAYKQLVTEVTQKQLDKTLKESQQKTAQRPTPTNDTDQKTKTTSTTAAKPVFAKNISRKSKTTTPKQESLLDRQDSSQAAPAETTLLKKETPSNDVPLNYLSTMVLDLYEQKLIENLDEASIQKGLSDHCKQTISKEIAAMLSRILLNRQEEYC